MAEKILSFIKRLDTTNVDPDAYRVIYHHVGSCRCSNFTVNICCPYSCQRKMCNLVNYYLLDMVYCSPCSIQKIKKVISNCAGAIIFIETIREEKSRWLSIKKFSHLYHFTHQSPPFSRKSLECNRSYINSSIAKQRLHKMHNGQQVQKWTN